MSLLGKGETTGVCLLSSRCFLAYFYAITCLSAFPEKIYYALETH